MSAIPSLDLSKAKTHRKELASQLTRALEEVGFLYLDNVGGFDPDELLKVTKWFFSLPLEKRLAISTKQWAPTSSHVYRGYFPIVPGRVENKEALEIGADLPPGDPFMRAGYVVYENNQWPEEQNESCPNFKEIVLKYFEMFSDVATEIMHLLAIGMNVDEHSFDQLFLPKPLSTFRLLHYPPRGDDFPPLAKEGDVVIQCAAHCDTVLVTILATFENRGLEILDSEGKWIAVEPRPHSLVINIGELLAKMSRNRFKATRHRVVYMGEDRYSVPFFLEPYGRADVSLYLDEYAEMYKTGQVPMSSEPLFYANYVTRSNKRRVEYEDTDFGPDMA